MEHPLVWVDLEMTGLDPDRDVVVEIAVLITDGSLEQRVEGPDLVLAASEESLAGMDPVVAKMHAKSGLTDAIRASTLTAEEASEQVFAFLREHVPEPRTAPLAGNSIHADRMFLRRHLPAVEAHLHYRNLDVSTVKELARRWRPDVLAAAPRKGGGHRAMADIVESIEELRYYRETFFRAGPPA